MPRQRAIPRIDEELDHGLQSDMLVAYLNLWEVANEKTDGDGAGADCTDSSYWLNMLGKSKSCRLETRSHGYKPILPTGINLPEVQGTYGTWSHA